MSRLIVSYSRSAVLPRDLLLGLDWCEEVLFVVDPTVATSAPPALLSDLGRVVPVHPDAVPWEQLRGFRPDGIVTFSEDLLPLTALLARGLGLPHTSEETVAVLRDKRLQREALRRRGVDRTRTSALVSADDWPTALREVGLPLVLKPARGAGSTDTVAVTDADEGARWCAEQLRAQPDRPLVAEELLVGVDRHPFGDYVSVESLVVDGEVHHLGVTGKLPLLAPFRETGQLLPAPLHDAESAQVERLTTDAIRALGVDHGAVHTEVKLTADGPRLIEVNGRLGGYISELYGRATGVDVIEVATRAACGHAVDVPRARPRQVVFQYTHQPPRGAVRLTGLDGARAVARHPAVSRYDRLTAVGSDLPQDDRTHDLDLLCGQADSLDRLPDVLAEVRALLTFTFDTTSGPVQLRGIDLSDEPAVAGGPR